jgi:hypothetical protein
LAQSGHIHQRLGDHVQTEHLAVALGVDTDRDHDRDVDDPAALADLLGEGVHPQIGVGAGVEGSVAELSDHLVELGGRATHLGLRQRLDTQRLDQAVDAAGRHTPHIALGDHGHERGTTEGGSVPFLNASHALTTPAQGPQEAPGSGSPSPATSSSSTVGAW